MGLFIFGVLVGFIITGLLLTGDTTEVKELRELAEKLGYTWKDGGIWIKSRKKESL